MIRLLHFRRDAHVATEGDVAELAALRREGWVWLDLSGADADEITRIGEMLGLEEEHVADAVGDTRLSMVDEGDGYFYTVVFGYLSGRGERLASTRLAVFAGPDFLVTVSPDELPGLRWVQAQLTAGQPLSNASPVGLLASLGLAGGRRLHPLIQELEGQIDHLEDLAIAADPRTITRAYALRRDVILLQRLLTPQRNVYEDLADARHPLIDEESADDLKRVAHHLTHALDSLQAAQTLLESVLEIHRGAVADQTNEIVRVLTVFSAVMLPLTLIAGVWGMNFVEIPAAEERWGFWGLLGLMAMLAVGLWLYFARRGFVGAPRLRDLPKAAGLGLIQVGVAPIKVVAGGIESTMRFVGLRDSDQEPG